MYTIKKQSNIDYQIKLNGQHYAWVTKYTAGYIMDNTAQIFKTLTDVKKYIHNL